MKSTITEALIADILNTHFEDIEQEVIDNTKRRILDMISNANRRKSSVHENIAQNTRPLFQGEVGSPPPPPPETKTVPMVYHLDRLVFDRLTF